MNKKVHLLRPVPGKFRFPVSGSKGNVSDGKDSLLDAALLALQIVGDHEGALFEREWRGYGMSAGQQEALEKALKGFVMPEVGKK